MATSSIDLIGQYASDAIVHAGDPALHADPNSQKAIRGDGTFGFHGDHTLFDQADEDTGEVSSILAPDEAEVLALEGMRVVTKIREDQPEKLDDEAEDWLRSFDPEHPDYRPKSQPKYQSEDKV